VAISTGLLRSLLFTRNDIKLQSLLSAGGSRNYCYYLRAKFVVE